MGANTAFDVEPLIGDEAKELYVKRGFSGRVGFGSRPALILIDMANAWTRAEYPFVCDDMENVIPATQQILDACRDKNMPIVFITTGFSRTEGPYTDMGRKHLKIPALRILQLGSRAVEIDERLRPRDDEFLIVKKQTSAFHGTHLSALLTAAEVDTTILVGVTAAGCVRNTAEDAIADGFRPIVVRECVGDRLPGAVEVALFDIDAKFGDVESLDTVLNWLANAREEARHDCGSTEGGAA